MQALNNVDDVCVAQQPVNADKPKLLIICIEGNISAGKTTLLQRLSTILSNLRCPQECVVVLKEPVEEWRKRGFLEAMYEETLSKAEFQHMALASLYADLQAAVSHTPRPKLIITERSVWSNLAVFARLNLNELSLRVFEHTFNLHMANAAFSDAEFRFVLLDTSVNTIAQRMRARGRDEEKGISLDYLTSIHDKMREWLRGVFHRHVHFVNGDNDKDISFTAVLKVLIDIVRAEDAGARSTIGFLTAALHAVSETA